MAHVRTQPLMLLQIGRIAPNFSDPTGLMSDCHRRIELFLSVLKVVATEAATPLDADNRHALDKALQYFRESAPWHSEDEELSLFPRLREIQDQKVRELMDQLDALEAEHHWAQAFHEELERLGRQWLRDGHIVVMDRERFLGAVRALEAMYERHIQVEEGIVFPTADEMLAAEQKQAIGREMAKRRQHQPLVKPV